jgi:hypothetical protein
MADERHEQSKAAHAAPEATGENRDGLEPPAPQPGHVVVHDAGTIDAGDITANPVRQRGLPDKLVTEETVRAGLALLLFLLLTGIIVAAMWRAKTWEQTKALLDSVLPLVTALLGSAIGFYFGTRVSR